MLEVEIIGAAKNIYTISTQEMTAFLVGTLVTCSQLSDACLLVHSEL